MPPAISQTSVARHSIRWYPLLYEDCSGKLKREQARSVVDKTLSFEDVYDPAR